MNYLEKLKLLESKNPTASQLPKLSEAPFDSFGSNPTNSFSRAGRSKALDKPEDFWERVQAIRPHHEAFINHLMRCGACYAPQARYCREGNQLHEGLAVLWASNSPDENH